MFKETFTISRPDIAENFMTLLKSQCTEDEGRIIFNEEHLNSCLNMLSSSLMAREKLAYEKYERYCFLYIFFKLIVRLLVCCILYLLL